MTETKDLKLISDYAHLSFNEAVELDCYTFKLILRDAFVDKMSASEEGRDYLEQAWTLKQTSPDRETLRKSIGRF